MNTVEPIREFDLILDIADYLKDKRDRDYVLFMTGIYLGRRISDILPFRVRDIKDREHIYITEEKTGKEIKIAINKELQAIYKDYCKGKKAWEYLFRGTGRKKPISRQRVWQILNEAADEFEYKDRIGCHSLRKTFGYWLYQNTHDVVAIQELLNHDDPSITKRYIGINQDTKDSMVNGLSFKKKR